MARPRIPNELKRRHQVAVALSDREAGALEREADRRGTTRAAVLRESFLACGAMEEPEAEGLSI
jgi:hypothetical protein